MRSSQIGLAACQLRRCRSQISVAAGDLRTEALLRTLGLADDTKAAAWRDESDAAVRAAIEAAETTPAPAPESMFSDVLAPYPPPAPS